MSFLRIAPAKVSSSLGVHESRKTPLTFISGRSRKQPTEKQGWKPCVATSLSSTILETLGWYRQSGMTRNERELTRIGDWELLQFVSLHVDSRLNTLSRSESARQNLTFAGFLASITRLHESYVGVNHCSRWPLLRRPLR